MSFASLAFIDAAGIHVPDYPTILNYLTTQYTNIYGANTYLAADSQDGQWLAIQAQALSDACQLCAAAYNSVSPATSIGAGLDRNVSLAGLSRNPASPGSVLTNIQGVVGATISAGTQVASVSTNCVFQFQADYTITTAANQNVTLVQVAGDPTVTCPAGDVTKFLQAVPPNTTSWNTVPSVPGYGLESDGSLRARWFRSRNAIGQSMIGDVQTAIENVTGVQSAIVYENPTSAGSPIYGMYESGANIGHSICAVVQYTSAAPIDIATAIYRNKSLGCNTVGSASYAVGTESGMTETINWVPATPFNATFYVTLSALPGYNATAAQNAIWAGLTAWCPTVPIGTEVSLYSSFPYIYAAAGQVANTFVIRSINTYVNNVPLPDAVLQLGIQQFLQYSGLFITQQ